MLALSKEAEAHRSDRRCGERQARAAQKRAAIEGGRARCNRRILMRRVALGWLRQLHPRQGRARHRPGAEPAAVARQPGIEIGRLRRSQDARVKPGRPHGRLLLDLRTAFPDCHIAPHPEFGH